MSKTEVATRTVYVVDDDAAVRDSLDILLTSDGFAVRTFASGEHLLDSFAEVGQGCVVMDVRMPGLDGIQVQARLSEQKPELAVLLMTGDGDVPLAVRALKGGARDFLEKPFVPEAFLECVRHLMSAHVDRPAEDARNKIASLTVREREVLKRLVSGDTNKEIARHLQSSPRTVEIHRARVMSKLSVRGLAEAVRIAISAGL